MQIQTIWKRFEAFASKFEPFERDSMLLNVNLNHSKGIRTIRMQIWTIRKGFEPFESDLKHSNANSNHLNKGIQSFRMPIQSIWIQTLTIWKGFEAFERDAKHSKGSQMQIVTILKFNAFECKF